MAGVEDDLASKEVRAFAATGSVLTSKGFSVEKLTHRRKFWGDRGDRCFSHQSPVTSHQPPVTSHQPPVTR
ncbi:hypothetical protein POG22_08075 [Geitlerinema sp. CS-897]|nr:hypothetical protein [Geitlerinema sp. CS-897]